MIRVEDVCAVGLREGGRRREERVKGGRLGAVRGRGLGGRILRRGALLALPARGRRCFVGCIVGEVVKMVVVLVDAGVVLYSDSVGSNRRSWCRAVEVGCFLRRETVGRGARRRRWERIMRIRGC